jgi:Tol biopolymer transport system component
MLFGGHGDDAAHLELVDGAEVRELEVSAVATAVSPDESRIAFTNGRGVWIAAADGSGLRRVAPVASGEDIDQIAFAPDGRRVAYVRVSRRADDTAGTLQVLDVEDGSSSTVLEGSELLQTGGMTAVTWRDDEHLLCALFGDPSRRPETTLHEIPIDGVQRAGEPRPLHTFEDAAGVTELRMTPAGLYFMKLVAQADVQAASLTDDGSLEAPRRLTESEQNDRPGAVDAEGRVLFTSDRMGDWDLFRRGLDAPRAERLSAGAAHDTYPRVGPDGAVLFFRLEVREGGAIEATRVMRLEPDGEARALFELAAERRLRPGGRPPPEAARLRCGRSGCLVSTVAGEHLRMERFDAETGEREPFLELDAPESFHDWDLSPDGSTLALVLGDNELTLVPVADPTSRRVIRVADTGRLMGIAWSPDGGWLATTGVHVGDDRYVVLRVDLDGGVRVLHRSTNAFFAHVAFSGDGRTLVFAQQNYDLDVWRLDGWP